jgi:hypothetical protein
LNRLADGYGIEFRRFLVMVWPDLDIYRYDIDMWGHGVLAASLVELTGANREEIARTNFEEYNVLLAPGLSDGRSTASWGFSYGREALQFCPQCLDSNEPYYKKYWRLALFAGCSFHKTLLMDRCPYCNGWNHPHRGGLSGLRSFVAKAKALMTQCCHCGWDLQKAPSQARIPQCLVSSQLFWESALSEGGRPEPVWLKYFDSLWDLVKFLMSERSRTFRRFATFEASLSDLIQVHNAPWSEFGDLPPEGRAQVMGLAAWLLEDWPNRFDRIFGACPDLESDPAKEWFDGLIRTAATV